MSNEIDGIEQMNTTVADLNKWVSGTPLLNPNLKSNITKTIDNMVKTLTTAMNTDDFKLTDEEANAMVSSLNQITDIFLSLVVEQPLTKDDIEIMYKMGLLVANCNRATVNVGVVDTKVRIITSYHTNTFLMVDAQLLLKETMRKMRRLLDLHPDGHEFAKHYLDSLDK